MSAIAGIFHMNGEPVSTEQSNGMMKSLEKYPADDVQTWHNGNVFLGCHAQWITPESVGEKLPYYDHERKLAITADAIIDNRDELFDKLNIAKDKRAQMTDSELILLAYEKWGEESPKHLIGDFAYMIWDEREQKLFGARDFSGRRTLYYFHNGNHFVFCTTIHPILSLPYIEKALNEDWLAEFIAIPYIFDTIDTFSTVYKNILQVPPSHMISVDFSNNVNLTRYCFANEVEPLRLKSKDEYDEAFRDVFQSAVNARLRTHRKVGAHLSGGLDSSSVASFAARALRNENKKLHTLSSIPLHDFIDWTPKWRLADERPFIHSTVQYVGNIEDHYLDFEGKSPLSEMDDYIEIMEMPYKFFENSYWLKGFYEKASELGIGVLLNGKMGNFTISWGPALEYYATLLKRFKLIRYYQEINKYSKNLGVDKSRITSIVRNKAFPARNSNLPKETNGFPIMINREFAKKTNVFHKLELEGIDIRGIITPNTIEIRENEFGKLFYLNIGSSNITKLSLVNGLWERDPTYDLRVVQFCLSLPIEQFVDKGINRALIRRGTKNYLPDMVRLNQRVRGIQGADGIHRMKPFWEYLMQEFKKISKDPDMSEYLNMKIIRESILKLGNIPQPDKVYEPEFKILMRSLIIYRFIKSFSRKEVTI